MNDQIVISGGGVPGLILAILLGQKNLPVSVIDPNFPYAPESPDNQLYGQTTALMSDSLKLLEKTHVLESIREHCGEMNRLVIRDCTSLDEIESGFDSLEINQQSFGLNVPGAILRASLAKKAEEYDNIHLFFGRKLYDFSTKNEHLEIRMDDSSLLEAGLLVGADGSHSLVREISGIKSTIKDYKQSALTFALSHRKPHRKTSVELHHPAGPLTFVPLANPNQSSAVWVENTQTAQDLLQLSNSEFQQKLQNASKGVLGEIQVETQPHEKPLRLVYASSLTAPRVALVAEAAHTIHPMGAQGLNLSLRDVRELYKIIQEFHDLGLDFGVPGALNRYERIRSTDIKARIIATHSLAHSLNHSLPPLHSARRHALKAISRLPLVKRGLMKMGMTGYIGNSL